MDRERDPNEGLHETSESGESLTVNSTDDPQFPTDSYYQSQQGPDYDKTTNIFSSDGELLAEHPSDDD